MTNNLLVHLSESVQIEIVPASDAVHDRASPLGIVQDVNVFYDWIEDLNGNVCGISLHIDRNHLFASGLKCRRYVSFDPYLTVWFTEQRNGTPRGLEAFGDIELLESTMGGQTVKVSTDWLEEEDLPYMRRISLSKKEN